MGGSGSWRRMVGNARSFIGNSMGGLRGGTNLASWAVAGTLAYFLWVKPSQDLKRQQQVRRTALFFFSFSSYINICFSSSSSSSISLVLFIRMKWMNEWIFLGSGKGSSGRCFCRSSPLRWETKTPSWSSGYFITLYYHYYAPAPISLIFFFFLDMV